MDPTPTIPIFSTLMSRRSRSVVKQLDWFMYLEESSEVIREEYEIDHIDYDEAISDVDAHLWQKAMEVELESL